MKHIIQLTLITCMLLGITTVVAQEPMKLDEKAQKNLEANRECLQCHGNKSYVYHNPDLDRDIKASMCSERRIDSTEYYISNHRSFKCTGCHSAEYSTFPHPGALRMEEKYKCNDCHGGDEDWAHFSFDQIEEEFNLSVHSAKFDESFSCWMCHNPHEYHITARNEENIIQTIAYDNGICLNCHANPTRFQLLSDKKYPDVVSLHDWLPNQALHFGKVRCIECHAEVREDILVAHNIRPKEEAIKNCVECHSSNSRLMSTLYKHTVREARVEGGFLNSAIVSQGFVIGANRNTYLNQWSLYIFLAALGVLLVHTIFRIILKSK